MMHRVICLLICFLFFLDAECQFTELQFYIADEETKNPVSDSHAFISNSSFGTISEADGSVSLSVPKSVKDDLIISHLSYDIKVLRYSSIRKLTKMDTIWLSPNGVNMDEIVVTQKRSKVWKKNFKRFREAFIGTGKQASKCKILNPEVLRFSSTNDVFTATAIDMLSIQNDYLGYKVEFLLEKLSIDKNGSQKYVGHAKFVDIAEAKKLKKINKNRNEAYKRSTKHFFEHLIHDNLEKGKYKIRSVKYENGVFNELSIPEVKDIIHFDNNSQHYLLIFDEFLEIKHLGFKEIKDVGLGMQQGGLESTRFNSNQQRSSSRISYPISYLYKLTPTLIINKFGNVVNHKAVQEYGYWASQHMAQRLPLDYGNDYSDYEDITSDITTEKPKTKPQENQIAQSANKSSLDVVKDLIYGDKDIREKALEYTHSNWNLKFLAPLLDLQRINQDPNMHQKLTDLLNEKIGVSNYYEGLQWMWERESTYDSLYGSVKAEVYQHVDPKFKKYFDQRDTTATIGLDEIVWGGVDQDGIPPLRNPEMIAAADADYLDDNDIIFGISLEGDHRAYPKRILAWHEFFVDQISGKNIAGVYCTLCGTMIAYDMNHNGKFYDLGTSGFLYKSNKLMYDMATQSLWSTIEGTPVLGPLTNQEIRLKSYPIVTTTWGEWKKLHPQSKVLSLNTGHQRNYDEGEAYKSYFATDNLMFPVPKMDNRLKNKDEVMIVRSSGYLEDPLAISIDYLKKERIIQVEISGNRIVIIAKKDGWSRAYYAGDIEFKSYKKGILKDKKGNKWNISENYISSPDGQKLDRIPSHNSFWFAWFNAYPNTRLIK